MKGGAEPRMEIVEGIQDAIEAAVQAGVFRKAERLNPKSAATWAKVAEPHSRRANACLDTAMRRLGVRAPRW